MKKTTFFACLAFFLGATVPAGATDPFDIGQTRMSATEALLNMGIYAITHPDSLKEAMEAPNQPPKTKDELVMDKKIDDAIDKAWGKNNPE